MFENWFEDVENENDDIGYGIAYESECCGYTRECDIYNAIAEYQRSNVWD